jgi:hypothetical protein
MPVAGKAPGADLAGCGQVPAGGHGAQECGARVRGDSGMARNIETKFEGRGMKGARPFPG